MDTIYDDLAKYSFIISNIEKKLRNELRGKKVKIIKGEIDFDERCTNRNGKFKVGDTGKIFNVCIERDDYPADFSFVITISVDMDRQLKAAHVWTGDLCEIEILDQ